MQQFLDWFDAYSWIPYIFLIVFAALLLSYIAKRIFDRVQKRLQDTPNAIDDAVFTAVRKPVRYAIAIFGLIMAAEVARLQSEATIFQFIGPARNLAIIFLLGWFGYRLIGNFETVYADSEANAMDRNTLSAIAKILRATVLITSLLIALDSLGVPISGVLAFGGVGGIAVGFAARDLLANFFGAFMLFLDKPFGVGDWIRSPDQEIEGTVESIGWRITRIRTFDKRPLYIPNATFSSLTVENPSRMTNRRIYETIGVRYDDISVIPKILQDIRNMLLNHEEIDARQTLMVNLNEFSASSVDFFIYTFTKTTVWTDFHDIKEDVLLRISNIISSHGAEMAFPTQTLHVNEIPHPQEISKPRSEVAQ